MRKTPFVLAALLAVAGISSCCGRRSQDIGCNPAQTPPCRASSKNESRSSSTPNCWRLYKSITASFTQKSNPVLLIWKPAKNPPPT